MIQLQSKHAEKSEIPLMEAEPAVLGGGCVDIG